MACPIPTTRKYPLRKPPNHTLPIPRYTVTLPAPISHIHTIYLGLQLQSPTPNPQALASAISTITALTQSLNPGALESFTSIDLSPSPNSDPDTSPETPPQTLIWTLYFSSSSLTPSPFPTISLPSLYHSLTITHPTLPLGVWLESFTTRTPHLETNYSGNDYLPGLARLPSTTVSEHDIATYWGAARDRIPGSGWDLFGRGDGTEEGRREGGMEKEEGGETRGKKNGEEKVEGKVKAKDDSSGLGAILRGTNAHNTVHIRSGQFWSRCLAAERLAYEEKLEPALRKGLAYLNENSKETGCLCIRYLRNVTLDKDGAIHSGDGRETCGAGFFQNLADLERWARSHGSHLRIWGGAMAHYKRFREGRMLRTWHEVSVIREGDARFEYVNCRGGTGVMGRVALERESL